MARVSSARSRLDGTNTYHAYHPLGSRDFETTVCLRGDTLGGGVHQALPVCLCRTVFSISSYAPALGLELQLTAEELGGQANSNRDLLA